MQYWYVIWLVVDAPEHSMIQHTAGPENCHYIVLHFFMHSYIKSTVCVLTKRWAQDVRPDAGTGGLGRHRADSAFVTLYVTLGSHSGTVPDYVMPARSSHSVSSHVLQQTCTLHLLWSCRRMVAVRALSLLSSHRTFTPVRPWKDPAGVLGFDPS